MSGKESPIPVNVDPRWCVQRCRVGCEDQQLTRDYSIQEALQVYLQPIKNDGSWLDFYIIVDKATRPFKGVVRAPDAVLARGYCL